MSNGRSLGEALYNDLTGQGKFAITPEEAQKMKDDILEEITDYIAFSRTADDMGQDTVAADTLVAIANEVVARNPLSAEEEAFIKETAERILAKILDENK